MSYQIGALAPVTIPFNAKADASGNATISTPMRALNWVKVKMVATGAGSPQWALSTTTGPIGFATGNNPESSPMVLPRAELLTLKVTGATAGSAIFGQYVGVEGSDYQAVLNSPVFGGTVNVSVVANTNITQVGGAAISLGQAAPAASIPVVLATGSTQHVVTDTGSVITTIADNDSRHLGQIDNRYSPTTVLLSTEAVVGGGFTTDAPVLGNSNRVFKVIVNQVEAIGAAGNESLVIQNSGATVSLVHCLDQPSGPRYWVFDWWPNGLLLSSIGWGAALNTRYFNNDSVNHNYHIAWWYS